MNGNHLYRFMEEIMASNFDASGKAWMLYNLKNISTATYVKTWDREFLNITRKIEDYMRGL